MHDLILLAFGACGGGASGPCGGCGRFGRRGGKRNLLPQPAIIHIHIEIGQPLHPTQFANWPDEKLLAEIEHRIKQCHQQAREHRRRIR